jgi:hypothetical protein
MNPFGMPPPGMPYAERRQFSLWEFYEQILTAFLALLPHEIEEERLRADATSQNVGHGIDAEMSDGSVESDSGKLNILVI